MLGALKFRTHRALAMALGVLVVAVSLVAVQPPQPAKAALSGSSFDPGYIISDYEFFDKTAMTQAEIQTFLTKECGATSCLGHLNFPTTSEQADSYCTSAYSGAASETAAAILYKVEQACGISAKVLIVTLQKEQGLITKVSPSTGALRAAMGYRCPDSAPCSASSLGFFRQIYDAAWQFQEYRVYAPHSTAYPIGKNAIHYSPTTSCGSQSVTIRNEATRGLYIYTPYVPNSAALKNLTGLGNSCSSYGNRNFWVYYSTWFGSPTTTVPPSITTVSRFYGADRYATAVAVSKSNFTPGVPVVYIANGTSYADGQTAAAAAAKQGGPLLLVKSTSIPSEVLSEIQRLKPQKIVVVGSTSTISAAVYTQLTPLVTAAVPANIIRIGGADVYATSRDLAAYAFGPTVPKVFIATGANVWDTLAASSAAGTEGVPIILVKGTDTTVDSETSAQLQSFGTTRVVMVGGTPSISASMASALSKVPGVTSAIRYAGTDLYSLSWLINEGEFTSATHEYVVGTNDYQDAFEGAATAAANHSPLYFVHTTCIPSHTLDDFVALAPTTLVLLGGTAGLSANVGKFVGC